MIRVFRFAFIIVILALVLCSQRLFAQSEQNFDSQKLEKKLALDFPIINALETINIDRIKNGNLLSGSVLQPWQSTVRFSPKNDIPIPRVYFATDFLRVVVKNNIGKAVNGIDVRKNRSFELTAETSLPREKFGVLVGFNGLIGKEEIPEIDYGNFVADFNRKYYSRRGWVGIRVFEGFNGSFLALKVGRGVVSTKANYGTWLLNYQNYNHGYNREFVAFEARKTDYHSLAYSISIENSWYNRVPVVKDEMVFGKNEFHNLTFKHAIEFVILPWLDHIRGFIELNQNYGTDEHLLFSNNPPKIQFYLRIVL